MRKWLSVRAPKPSQHDSDKSKLVLVGVTFAKTAWTFHACLCLILKGKPVVPCGVDFGLPLELLPTYSRDEKRVRLSWLLFAVWCSPR